jgi:hypothetical protein
MSARKQKKELISLAELARRAGVGRAAITAFVKKNEAAGLITVFPEGRRNKKVDLHAPAIQAYIQNAGHERGGKPKPAGEAELRRLKNRLENIRLKNKKLQEKYIGRDYMFEALDKYQEYSGLELHAMIGRVIARLKTQFGLNAKTEKQVRGILTERVDLALESSAREIAAFKRKALYGA